MVDINKYGSFDGGGDVFTSAAAGHGDYCTSQQ